MRCSVFFIAVFLVGCSDDPPDLEVRDREACLTARDGTAFCIDVYEASREDASMDDVGSDDASGARSLESRRPWTNITWEGARAACEARGKRLCERDEWLDACDGQVGEEGGTMFVYGDEVDPTVCNTAGDGVVEGGRFSACEATTGTLDQNGNIWEWTGNNRASAAARGGSFRSTRTHACTAGDDAATAPFGPDDVSEELGFRCCRDR